MRFKGTDGKVLAVDQDPDEASIFTLTIYGPRGAAMGSVDLPAALAKDAALALAGVTVR